MLRIATLRRHLPATLMAVSCWVGAVSAAEPVTRFDGSEPARDAAVYSYAAPGGENYMALLLSADPQPRTDVPRDHVLLVDTSASQVGAHRRQALAVVEALLPSLSAGDRVSIMAVDLTAERLTDGFVEPAGDAAAAALETLRRRAPLGATNLARGVKAALDQFPADDERLGSIVYIGDGMSMAELLDSAEMRRLLSNLTSRRVPVHSYAVGPRQDLQLLGVLAQRTGGVVMFDVAGDQVDAPVNVARRLADAVAAPVYYPENISIEPKGLALLPAEALPLRSDRATVYLAKGQPVESVSLTFTGDRPALTRTVAREDFQTRNTFLHSLWQQSAGDGGLSVAYAGNRMLRAAQAAFDNNVANMVVAGQRAVAARNGRQAEQIALAVQNADPGNVDAKVLLRSAEKLQNVVFLQPGDDDDSLLDNPDVIEGLPPADRDLTLDVEQLRRFRTEKVLQQVNRSIEDALAVAATDPVAALEEIKRREDDLRAIEDINPAVRQDLLKRLRNVGLQLSNQILKVQEVQALAAERQAAAEAQARLLSLATQEEEDLEQLIDRVRALMVEGMHGDDDAFEAAEAVAQAAVNLRPGNGPATAALITAEAAGQLNKAFRLRELRADRFLETLYQVELSHVPFPDEPPIRWPDPQVWKALTERRKKWASVDLHKNSPAEEKIQAALIDPLGVDLEFGDNTLSEVVAFLQDAHDITILLDRRALEEEGIDPEDERVTLSLAGVTLRSALKIILEPLDLTYIIEDEVMKIVPISVADTKLSTRVYPVGDLVIPITNPLAAGLGQGFGGVGGFQGGGGFGAGGQFGQGAAPFGGPQAGGGAGVFNIPPGQMPALPATPAKNVAPQPGTQPAAQPAVPAVRRVRDAEVENLLDSIIDGDATSCVESPFGLGFAQVQDTQDGGFRLDNATVEALKKKPNNNR